MATNVVSCPDVSTLRATRGTPSSSMALLTGHSQAGDGGEGQFYWVASADPLAARLAGDDGTIFAASDSGFWVRIFSGPLSVKWFGAQGRGTDDTSAIMSALTAASVAFAGVYFPPGSYYVSPPITIPVKAGVISSIADVSLDGDANLYIADAAANTVYKLVRMNGVYQKPPALVGAVSSLAAMAAGTNGNVYMFDATSKVVIECAFNISNNVYGLPKPVTPPGPFSDVTGMAVDSAGNLYLADKGNKTIFQAKLVNGGYQTPTPIAPAGPSSFAALAGIAVDGGDNIYAADPLNKTVYRLTLVKNVYQATPVAPVGTFSDPAGVAVDDSGNLYVADAGKKMAYQVALAGGVYQAPRPLVPLTRVPAIFSSLAGIAVDGSGSNVIVADSTAECVYQVAQAPLVLDYRSNGYRISSITGAGVFTTIVGVNVPDGHAVIELLGFSNVEAVNSELKDFQIMQDTTCGAQSYALRMGDAKAGFSAERMVFRGANGVLLRISSSVSYAQMCTVFRNCTLMSNEGGAWTNAAAKDQPFYSLGSESHGAQWDNVLFESCLFEGLVSCLANIVEFDNCQFSTDASRGAQFGCCAEVLVDNATFHDCYFEDHYAAIRIQPSQYDVRRVSIYDCYFSGNRNIAGEGNKGGYGVWLQPGPPKGRIQEVNVARCVFTDDLYRQFGGASVQVDPPSNYVSNLRIDGAVNVGYDRNLQQQFTNQAPITVIGPYSTSRTEKVRFRGTAVDPNNNPGLHSAPLEGTVHCLSYFASRRCWVTGVTIYIDNAGGGLKLSAMKTSVYLIKRSGHTISDIVLALGAFTFLKQTPNTVLAACYLNPTHQNTGSPLYLLPEPDSPSGDAFSVALQVDPTETVLVGSNYLIEIELSF